MQKQPRRLSPWVGWVAFASLLGACAGPADQPGAPGAAAAEVEVALTTAASAVSQGQPVTIDVEVANRGTTGAELLRWLSPTEELEEPLFDVRFNGEPVAFVGPHFKRPASDAADFVALAAGASLTRGVDLSELYDFSRTGVYTIRYDVDGARLLATGGKVSSNTVTLWIEGRQPLSAYAAPQPPDAVVGNVSFTGRCDATQQDTILQAVSAASTMANGSVSYLGGNPSATPRYTTWFGAFSTSGWNTAQSHFVAIKDAFDTKPITVDCGCKKSYYAYVYPNQPYKIYVCRAFWSAPMTGTDSKGGTLIHETSHFTVVAGTDDWAYGQIAGEEPRGLATRRRRSTTPTATSTSPRTLRPCSSEAGSGGRSTNGSGAAPVLLSGGSMRWLLPFALLFVACARSKGGPVKLECEVSAPAQVAKGAPVELSFKLTNRGERPLHVLTWLTPLEGGLFGNALLVTRAGVELPFAGPMIKRGDPEADDYLELAPGKSAEAKIDAGLAYDLAAPGRYELAFRGTLFDVVLDGQVPRPRSGFHPLDVRCPAVTVERKP